MEPKQPLANLRLVKTSKETDHWSPETKSRLTIVGAYGRLGTVIPVTGKAHFQLMAQMLSKKHTRR
jgi:hypothetical protein